MSWKSSLRRIVVVSVLSSAGLIGSGGLVEAIAATPPTSIELAAAVQGQGNVPTPDAQFGECGDHAHPTLAHPADDNDDWNFRVTGSDLKDYFGAGNFGRVYFTLYDTDGSFGYGPYPASSDTGFNVPFTAYSPGNDTISITVDVTSTNDRTLCSSTYPVAKQYEDLR